MKTSEHHSDPKERSVSFLEAQHSHPLSYQTFTRFPANFTRLEPAGSDLGLGGAVEKSELLTIRVDGESGGTYGKCQKAEGRDDHRAMRSLVVQNEIRRKDGSLVTRSGVDCSMARNRLMDLAGGSGWFHHTLTGTDTFDKRARNPGSPAKRHR